MRIDLHTHTTASDGTDTPAELMAAAAAAQLDVVAITDHDTTAGWEPALAARPSGLTVVPGAEFSCYQRTADGRRISLHVLGYLFDPDAGALRAERLRLRESRLARARRIVENLAADGYAVSWPQVVDLAAGGSVGRPHIGRALVAAGAVPDVSTAFAELLSSRHKYFVPKQDTPVLDAVRMIRAARGLPVFAHPFARRRGPVVDDAVVAAMTDAGLVGIEVDHPDHGPDDRADAARLARRLGLVPLGSSDYHGTNKPTVLGACTTSPEALARLLEIPAARTPVAS
ncbi:MAG: 3,5-nucleoside bisphosphate phosphatase [Pseudonocardiales bacterium]|nr:3,5-nucleoside bisphosphate phosphatase [Pseudonocardiales bacterium]